MKTASTGVPGFLWVTVLLFFALAGCGGGSSSTSPTSVTLGGTAATGAPIVNGTVNVSCAGGGALTAVTGNDGAWQVTLSGQTLPCAVEVSGGNLPSGQAYHSIAVTSGTVNISPLTDLIVASLSGQAPSAWFAGQTATTLGQINASAVTAAVSKVRTALGLDGALNGLDPMTLPFAAKAGNAIDDALTAIKTASTSTGKDYAALLAAATGATFTPPAGMADAIVAALASASSGTSGSGTSGGGTTGGNSGSGAVPVQTSGSGYTIAYSAPELGIDARPGVTAAFDATSGALDGYSWNADENPSRGTLASSDLAGDGLITLGRWYNGTSAGNFYGSTFTLGQYAGFHYAVGMATSSMPTAGVSTYALSKQTTMTFGTYNIPISQTSGSASVDFASGKVAVDLVVTINGDAYTIRTSGGLTTLASSEATIYGSTFAGSGHIASASGCGAGGCNAYLQGFFAGQTAQDLALVVRLDNNTGSTWGSTALIFVKQ